MGRKYYWQQILSYQLKERYRCCTFYSLILIPTQTAMKLKSIGQLYCGYHALEKNEGSKSKVVQLSFTIEESKINLVQNSSIDLQQSWRM